MTDSEVVVAQTSAMVGHSSVDYNKAAAVSGDFNIDDSTVQVTDNTADYATETKAGDLISSYGSLYESNPMDHQSDIGAGNILDTSLNTTDLGSPNLMAMNYDAYQNSVNLVNTTAESAKYASYVSSVNANGVNGTTDVSIVGMTENGDSLVDGVGSVEMHQPRTGSALSAEEERLWSIVTANSLDFNAWTALIEETERVSEGDILNIRKVYDTFLEEFPLCYGYWKKYADHEARLSSIEKVVDVYERATQSVTYSVDMWLHYCVFAIGTYRDPDIIRRLFEKALAYVGTDYLCFPLWDKFIEYEISQQDWPGVATIYTRVLDIPNQQLDRYFEGFKELVASRPLSELRTSEEAAALVANSEVHDQENDVEFQTGASEQSHKPLSASLQDAEALEKYIAIREEIYKKAKEFDSKIIGFEAAIRRPYFHVRPLNINELENWHNYIDFIEAGGEFNKVVNLYERCLIACANYPDYWIRYVLCMESSGRMDRADNALARATQVFVKRQPEIHIFAARFKEKHGDISGARAAYQLVHTGISPGLIEAIIKHANMERRLGNLEDSVSLYEQAIAIEKGKEHSQTLPLLFAQYSRFMFLVSGQADKAREILDQGLESAQLSKPLLEAMIHLESIQPPPKRIVHLNSLVDKFVVPNPNNPTVATLAEREELSSIFLEFLDLFGDSDSIKKADERHAKLFLPHKSVVESKKRYADDYLGSDKTKLAKSLASQPTPAMMGAYAGQPNQWPAGYGLQPQAWPQASQSQAQQWTPGYTQQAAYGVYGTSYTHPQTPAPLPQNTAYGTYPSTYPAQAVPQQTSMQPAAAANMTAAQLPAAAPPPSYYGAYY